MVERTWFSPNANILSPTENSSSFGYGDVISSGNDITLSWFQFYHKVKFFDWRPFGINLTSHRCHFSDFDVILREAWFPPAFMMSKQAFMTSLILSGSVISTKMMSFFIYGHKKTKLQRLQQPSEFRFCGYSVVKTYLRGFQLGRIFFIRRELQGYSTWENEGRF